MKKFKLSLLALLISYTSISQLLTSTTSLNVPRMNFQAEVLDNGKVLAIGGAGVNGSNVVYHNSTELFNPIDESWTNTAPMILSREYFTSTKLLDGRILVVGGRTGDFAQGYFGTASCEIYDPTNNTWAYTDSLPFPSIHHSMVTLQDNKILVVNEFNQIAIFNQSTLTWSSASNSLFDHGWSNKLTLLDDGSVLCTGGEYDPYKTEIYNPINDSWSALPDMSVGRSGHTSILLSNGKVLIFGADNLSTTCELFDRSTNTFSVTGSLNMFRTESPAVLISGGKVLTYGRGSAIDFFDTKSIEIYDPSSGTWTAPVNNIQGSVGPQLKVLNDNRIMVIGGIVGTNSADFRCFFVGYTALGFSQKLSSNDVMIYPNPVKDKINFVFESNEKNIKIEILDLSGKVVYKSSEISSSNFSLNINFLNNGMYILKVISNDNDFITKKIIINK